MRQIKWTSTSIAFDCDEKYAIFNASIRFLTIFSILFIFHANFPIECYLRSNLFHFILIENVCVCVFFHRHIFFADLSRNRLAKVTNGAFVNLTNLTYLDLSYNKLVKLESASVEPLKKLHSLNISGNHQMNLYDIREAFQVSITREPYSV